MTINGDPNPSANNSSEDDDVQDDTYMPSPRAHPYGKGLASASDNGIVRDEQEIEEEEDGGNKNDGAEGMMRRRMKKFLMLRRSTQLLTYT
jgi:hypothetical protein